MADLDITSEGQKYQPNAIKNSKIEYTQKIKICDTFKTVIVHDKLRVGLLLQIKHYF